ncbi:MAG: sigma-70 family RNA polymerase sigma factor [Fluviicola sp.]|nr:sigma-70 family RNA polymerase sigma factor [Fluviicola sp.]MBP6271509.1 sigma-70 family RNA polymerase sigma factor [Fluviicola sp.]
MKTTTVSSWVQEHGDALYKRAFLKLKDKTLAEDIIQETFISAFQNFDKFKGSSSPLTWLYAILNNKIADHYRSNSSYRFCYDSIKEGDSADASDFFTKEGAWNLVDEKHVLNNSAVLLDDEEFNKVLAFCLENLPNQWNEAMTNKYLSNRNAQEICQDLSISMSNYWQIIHRAKLHLRKCIENNFFMNYR